MNPNAISFWLCATSGGYIIHNTMGAAVGLCVSTFASLIMAFTD
jgi:hypothetical protein